MSNTQTENFKESQKETIDDIVANLEKTLADTQTSLGRILELCHKLIGALEIPDPLDELVGLGNYRTNEDAKNEEGEDFVQEKLDEAGQDPKAGQ